MKKSVKIILAIILALAATGGVAYSMSAPMRVETKTLEAATAKLTFSEQGNYLYDRSMTVMSQISGEVLEITVKDGDSVKKGDVLAVVSASDYERQIEQLESNIAGYNAQISNLYAQEKESKTALSSSREGIAGQIREIDVALWNYNKTQKSLEKQLQIQEDIINENRNLVTILGKEYRQVRKDYNDGMVETTQVNAAHAAQVQAQAALDASLQQYEQMKSSGAGRESLEEQRNSLKSQLGLIDQRIGSSSAWAMQEYYNSLIGGTRKSIESMNEKLGQATITAPTDGIITDLPVKGSNLITAASGIATISAEPVIEVFVPIREIDGVHTGDTVELILDKRLGSESVSGTVTLIENEAKIKVSALGVEERKVRVLVTPRENKLHIGYAPDVKFTVMEEPNSIIAPKTAIFEKDGADVCWVVAGGVAELREIERGVETREGYVIKSGLAGGDIIVIDANIDGLKEGRRITGTIS